MSKNRPHKKPSASEKLFRTVVDLMQRKPSLETRRKEGRPARTKRLSRYERALFRNLSNILEEKDAIGRETGRHSLQFD
jgi:hypothetical protein